MQPRIGTKIRAYPAKLLRLGGALCAAVVVTAACSATVADVADVTVPDATVPDVTETTMAEDFTTVEPTASGDTTPETPATTAPAETDTAEPEADTAASETADDAQDADNAQDAPNGSDTGDTDTTADTTEPDTTEPDTTEDSDTGDTDTTEPAVWARWDHAEIAALMPECAASEHNDLRLDILSDWADRTGEAVKEANVPWPEWDGPVPSNWLVPSPEAAFVLHRRIERLGYDHSADGRYAWRWVTDAGILPHTSDAEFGKLTQESMTETAHLLTEWTLYRMQFPPAGSHESAADAMNTLLTHRAPGCVAAYMAIACDHPEMTRTETLAQPEMASPHMRYDSESSALGRALWSITCGQAPTTDNLAERAGDDL